MSAPDPAGHRRLGPDATATVTGRTLVAGRALGGRYQLTRLLARGGMAEVWEGHDTTLGRPVAIKILQDHLAADAVFVERFRREAITAARLGHHCIVATYDAGIDAGTAYIVMELVRGRTLRQLLTSTGPLDPALAVAIAVQIADALAYAHRSGLIHRDVKPANVLLCDEEGSTPQVKVTDFGIAKTTAELGQDLTATGTVLGTPKYFSPEQVEGRTEPDSRSDLYALGIVLFEMLAGRAPFDGPTEMATAVAHLREPPPSLTALRPGVPPAVDALVQRLLAKAPSDRPPTAVAARQALELLGRDLSASTRLNGHTPGSSSGRGSARANGSDGRVAPGPDRGLSGAPALNGPVGAGGWTPSPRGEPAKAGRWVRPPAEGRPADAAARTGSGATATPSRGVPSRSRPPAAGGSSERRPPVERASTSERSSPGPPLVVPRRRKRRDGRLVTVVVAAVVVAALVVAGVLIFGRSPSGRSVATGDGASGPPLKIRAVSVWMNNFRPPDNPTETGLAFDGNPHTAWQTAPYIGVDKAKFGNLYSGEGLAIELNGTQGVARLEVTSATRGWAASAYVADARPATGSQVTSWGAPTASRHDIKGNATFSLGGRKGRWVLLWLTNLGPVGQASIAELTVTRAVSG